MAFIPIIADFLEEAAPILEDAAGEIAEGVETFGAEIEEGAGELIDAAESATDTALESLENSIDKLFSEDVPSTIESCPVQEVETAETEAAEAAEAATTKTDALKEHILNGELDAARREMLGEVVARKPDGTPWDHVTELQNAQNGLLNRIEKINKELSYALSHSSMTDEYRQGLLDELSEASKLLDLTEDYLPR